MQLTIKRDMKFLGVQRKSGEIVEVEIGNAFNQLTPRALNGLVNGGSVDAPGMAPSSNSGMETHLRAKVEQMEGTVKVQASKIDVLQKSNDDLAGRLTKLEGGGNPETKKTRRQARAGSTKE